MALLEVESLRTHFFTREGVVRAVDWDGAQDDSERSDCDFLWVGRFGLSYGRKEYASSSVPR